MQFKLSRLMITWANVLWPISNCAIRIQQVSDNIPYRAPVQMNKAKAERTNDFFLNILNTQIHHNLHRNYDTLTISPSPKSRNSKRFPSSADALSWSNEYDQMIFAGDANPLSIKENPRSKCTINWHGRL